MQSARVYALSQLIFLVWLNLLFDIAARLGGVVTTITIRIECKFDIEFEFGFESFARSLGNKQKQNAAERAVAFDLCVSGPLRCSTHTNICSAVHTNTHGRANLCLFMHVLVGMTVRVFIVHRLVRL